MKPKHTPGPWWMAAHDETRFAVGCGNDELAVLNKRQDAALLAAAPEMLEALELVLKMQDAMRLEQDRMPRSFEAPQTVDAIGILVERAKTAIRKAKGE